MHTDPDEGSVKGKGPETLLPRRGSPFASVAPAVAPVGAPVGGASARAPDLLADEAGRLTADRAGPGQPAAGLQPEAPGGPSAPGVPGSPEAPAEGAALATLLTGNTMFDPEIQWRGIEIAPAEIGPQADLFKPGESLAADAALLGLFATDQRLRKCWAEIDQLEDEVTTIPRLSLKLAQSLLDELRSARNRLLSSRAQIEEAEREVGEVRYRLQRLERSKWFEQPGVIFVLLAVMLAVLIAGAATPLVVPALFDSLSAQLARLFSPQADFQLAYIWGTIFWGGLGGVTGALYSLWRHVADQKDYDVDYAMWYYANPLMGLILGAFVHILVTSGVLTFLQASPTVMYILAWVVGFQQNVAFKLVNSVIKRLGPADEKA